MHTLILGFDSFDPEIFESLASAGKMPNLAKYLQEDHSKERLHCRSDLYRSGSNPALRHYIDSSQAANRCLRLYSGIDEQ